MKQFSIEKKNPREFNDLFLKSLTERLTKENKKEVILLGDFNNDLIKSNSNANASEFLYIIYSSNLLPHVTSPTPLTSRSNDHTTVLTPKKKSSKQT